MRSNSFFSSVYVSPSYWASTIKSLFKGGSGKADRPTDTSSRATPTGGAGNVVSGGVLEDIDQNREVRGEKWYGSPGTIGIAQKMVRDTHVRRSLDSITGPIRAADWDFEPVSDDPIDQEIADFCRHVFFERNDWDRFLQQATGYLRDGFSLIEPTDDIRPLPSGRFKSLGDKGIVYTGFHHRPAWTVNRWIQSKDDPTKLAGVEQWIRGSDGEEPGYRPIDSQRLIRFTYEQEGANFAGFARLRSAFGPWKTKILFLVIDAIRHERQGVGIPRVNLPQELEPGDLELAQSILRDMRSHERGYIILPYGWSFGWETSGNVNTDIGQAIERCNRDIAFNVGSGFTLLGLSGNTGSHALAQTQQGQYEITLDGEVRFICNVMNHGMDGWSAVERIVRLNYGESRVAPKLVARNMPTRDWTTTLPIVHNMILSGGIRGDDRLESFIRKVMILPPADKKTMRVLPSQAQSPERIKTPEGGDTKQPDDPQPAKEQTQDQPPKEENTSKEVKVSKEGIEVKASKDTEQAKATALERLTAAHMTQVMLAFDKVALKALPIETVAPFLARSLLIDESEAQKWLEPLRNFTPAVTTTPVQQNSDKTDEPTEDNVDGEQSDNTPTENDGEEKTNE